MSILSAVIFLSSTLILLLGDGSGDLPGGPPDLTISIFTAEPNKDDGFRIELEIANKGSSSSDRTEAILWDEWDLLNGNRTRIGGITVPPLDAGEDHKTVLSWDPETSTPHRLWALIDPESSVKEVTASNNVGSIMVRLPKISGIRSPLDGDPSSDVIGTYLKGIPLTLPITVDLDREVDPDLLRIYIENETGSQKFAPYLTDGTFSAELDVSTFDDGINEFIINSTYARVPLDQRAFQLEVRELPSWSGSLMDPFVEFVKEDGCYLINGYIDIPTLDWNVPIESSSGSSNVMFAYTQKDILVEAKIGLDGRGSIEARGNIPLSISGSDFTLRVHGSEFLEDAWEDLIMSISGNVEMEGIGLFSHGGSFSTILKDGRSMDLPIRPIINGTASSNIDLGLRSDGITFGGGLELALHGNNTESYSLKLPGFDRPLMEIGSKVDWTSDHELQDNGTWATVGTIYLNNSVSVVDTGLPLTDTTPQNDLPDIGFGADLELTPEGGTASVMITREMGHNSAVTLDINGSKSQVSRDNRYRSSPSLEIMEDGSPLVVWTWSESWSTDPRDRFGSLMIMSSHGDQKGIFSGNGTPIDDTEGADLHPDLANYGSRTAVVWTRDIDSDPRTKGDMEILISVMEGINWSEPIQVTSNSISDDHASLVFDSFGDLWVAWLQDGTSAKIRKMEWDSRLWSSIVEFRGVGEGSTIFDLDMSGNGRDEVLIAVSTLNMIGEYEVWTMPAGRNIENLLGDPILIERTDHIVTELSVKEGEDEGLILSWISSSGGRNDIRFSIGTTLDENITWTGSLPLTDNENIEVSQLILPTKDGETLAYIPIIGPDGNLTIGDNGEIKNIDLSGAAGIEEVWYELLGDYKRWETVSISADVRNIGLSPTGKVYLNLDRISRDPVTGDLTRVSVQSKLVQFTGKGDIETISFTTTLVEYQIDYFLWASSSWGTPPAYTSSASVHLPVTSDPRIIHTAVEMDETDPFNATVRVIVKNDGLVTEDPLTIKVIGGKIGNVSSLCSNIEMKDLMILNQTTDGLGPQTQREYGLNITMVPGLNQIWVVILLQDGSQLMEGPLMADIIPNAVLEMDPSLILANRGDVISIPIKIKNLGAVDLLPSSESSGSVINISLLDTDGIVVMNRTYETSIPPPFSEYNITFPIETSLLPIGKYSIKVQILELDGIPFDPMKRGPIEKGLMILEKEKIVLSWSGDLVDFGFIGKAFMVNVTNPTNRTIPVSRVVLYNGVPGDDVVLSEAFITGIRPNVTESTALPLGIDEGLYVLSIEASTCLSTDISVPWNDMVKDSGTFEFTVEKYVPPREKDESLDMGDVTDSIMIGLSAIASVVLIAALFRRKNEVDEA